MSQARRARASLGLALTVAFVLGVSPGSPLTTSAAGTAAAPWVDLIPRLTTEQVEPGVFRVLSDGHRDLSSAATTSLPETYGEYTQTHMDRQLAASRDGSIWIFEPAGFYELGEAAEHAWPQARGASRSGDLRATRGGRLWRLVAGRTLSSFDGEGWTRHLRRQLPWGIDAGPDGTLWATWTTRGICFEPEGCTPNKLGRRNHRGWTAVDIPELFHYSGHLLAATADGGAWTCCRKAPWRRDPGLLRFDGRRWHIEQPPYEGKPDGPMLLDASDDGTLWLRRASGVLERYRDGQWTAFTEVDGVPPLSYTGSGEKLLAAPDGSVWVTPSVSTGSPDDELECDGVAHFDGTTLTRYLRDTCIFSMDVDRGGTLWLQGAKVDIEDIDLYRLGETVEPVQTFAIRAESLPGEPDR